VADSRASRRWQYGAFGAALVLALLGVGFLAWSIWQHQDARDDLTAARARLATHRAHTSADARALHLALDPVSRVKDQLASLAQGVVPLADLDQQDLDAVGAAVQAGDAGNLTGYNAAVDQRTALDPQHDSTLEQLRQQANEVITALDGMP
jgi:hypothetical protein